MVESAPRPGSDHLLHDILYRRGLAMRAVLDIAREDGQLVLTLWHINPFPTRLRVDVDTARMLRDALNQMLADQEIKDEHRSAII
ncbi:MAG: hypothetical protein WC977_09570 [Anaerovoracaceae bacterium]